MDLPPVFVKNNRRGKTRFYHGDKECRHSSHRYRALRQTTFMLAKIRGLEPCKVCAPCFVRSAPHHCTAYHHDPECRYLKRSEGDRPWTLRHLRRAICELRGLRPCQVCVR